MAKKSAASPEDFGMEFYGEDSALEKFAINDFIDTGSYNLNRIISGSFFKGIPEKRLTTFIGEEAVGKTLFALTIAREAQKKNYLVAYIDTENALTQEFAKAAGVNIKEMLYKQIVTVEDFRKTALKLIEWKTANYGKDKKLLLILDSIGGLTAKKFIDDVDEGKDTMDMGIFAKILKATLKMIGALMAPHNVTMLCTNHVTTDNSGYVPKQVQTGGKAASYYPSTVVMLKKRLVKDDDKQTTGIDIVAQTTKSRIVPPYQTAEIYLDWQKGLDPMAGVLDIMIELGIVSNSGGWYSFAGDSQKYRRNDIEVALRQSDELIKALDTKVQESGYKTISPLTEELVLPEKGE